MMFMIAVNILAVYYMPNSWLNLHILIYTLKNCVKVERDLSNVTYLVMGLAFKPKLADSKVEVLSYTALSYQVKLSCYSKMAVIPYISLALKNI